MTITSVRVYEAQEVAPSKTADQNSPKPPARIWQAGEPPFKGYTPAPSDGYAQSSADTAIVIDNGTQCDHSQTPPS